MLQSTKVLFGIQRRDRRYHETDQDVDQRQSYFLTSPYARRCLPNPERPFTPALLHRTPTHGIARPCLAQRKAGLATAGNFHKLGPFNVRDVQNELILHFEHLAKEN